MENDLSLHQRILNAAASLEVENLKARHAYFHGRADASGEWSQIWSRSREASWAHVFGRIRGFDQIWYGSVTCYDRMAMENWMQVVEHYPEVGGKDPRPLMEASIHTLVTDIIEVAKDGKSARGSFITPGVIHSVLTAEKKKYCNILWERYGSDFVLENGRWVYLHEQVCPDILTKMDANNWAMEDYKRLTDPLSAPPPPPTLGTPPVSDPGPLHLPYSILLKPQDTVPWPNPYETLDDNNSYTPLLGEK